MGPADQAVHDWYRFVLSFPPHLVREYVRDFGLTEHQTVLDPFCGTGTTLVECRKLGINGVGVEANPVAHFASRVKLDWSPDGDGLAAHACSVAEMAMAVLRADGLGDTIPPSSSIQGLALRGLPLESSKLLLTDSISSLPLHKALVLLECLETARDARYRDHELLALARTLAYCSSNLQFRPEVGVGPQKSDAPVITPWLQAVHRMADDLRTWAHRREVPATIHSGDARQLDACLITPVDAVITSPPYPNEKDYTRTTRLESVVLGFIRNKTELRELKQRLVRSNTRNVYKADDDDRSIGAFPEIQRIAEEIQTRRIQMSKTSGFERLYARVTRLYFGGMWRHLESLRPILRPGARLAYVVGDQASYLQVMIRTGELLAEIAQSLGYEWLETRLFRTRLSTATRAQLKEEIVILRWPG